MMAPSRALRLICRAGVAVLLRGVSSVELVWQQIAAATPATPIQPTATHFVPPDEMLDVGDGKNACNQAPCPNQKSTQRSEVFHFAKCEMAADRPSPLLFRAIAKSRAAPPRRARAARQTPERANVRHGCGRELQPPAPSRVHMIGAANRDAGNRLNRLPTFPPVPTDNAHH